MAGHFLIVEARFYGEIADAQAAGAVAALEAAGIAARLAPRPPLQR